MTRRFNSGWGSREKKPPRCPHCGYIGWPIYSISAGKQLTLDNAVIPHDKRPKVPICRSCGLKINVLDRRRDTT